MNLMNLTKKTEKYANLNLLTFVKQNLIKHYRQKKGENTYYK
jgi:hypothetical protein